MPVLSFLPSFLQSFAALSTCVCLSVCLSIYLSIYLSSSSSDFPWRRQQFASESLCLFWVFVWHRKRSGECCWRHSVRSVFALRSVPVIMTNVASLSGTAIRLSPVRLFPCPPVSVIPPVLHTALIRRTSGRRQAPSNEAMLFATSGTIRQENNCVWFC